MWVEQRKALQFTPKCEVWPESESWISIGWDAQFLRPRLDESSPTEKRRSLSFASSEKSTLIDSLNTFLELSAVFGYCSVSCSAWHPLPCMWPTNYLLTWQLNLTDINLNKETSVNLHYNPCGLSGNLWFSHLGCKWLCLRYVVLTTFLRQPSCLCLLDTHT